MAFQLNQRITLVDTGEQGRIVGIHEFIDIVMDNGRTLHTQLDGSSCCGGGSIRPVNNFELGQNVRYQYGSNLWVDGTVTEITDDYVRMTISHDQGVWQAGETRVFNLEGGYHSRHPEHGTTRGRLIRLPEPGQTSFKVDQRVSYCMPNGTSADGVVTRITDNLIYVKLDDDQTHIRYVHRERAFQLDGAGTGSRYDLDVGTRETERGSVLIPAPKEWTMTPGREYPEEPRLGYGVFDGNYGRPLEEGNPMGYDPQVGWGVINVTDTAFSQGIYQSEEDAKSAGYYANAVAMWKQKCLDIDLAHVEHPLETLKGLDIISMWLHADNFGCEFGIAPNPARRRIQFNYPRACCTAGIMTMDELNGWFASNAGSMKVVDVDGTKLTIQGISETIEFHVLPKLIENFKPEFGTGDLNVKKLLLQNLASQSDERDSLALAA